MMHYTHVTTPIGPLLVAGDEVGLRCIGFPRGSGTRVPEPGWREDATPLREAVRQLAAYFHGELQEFTLDLAPVGTPFRLRVWDALREIPYGETRTYGDIARAIGQPAASRAVGGANHANPLPIVIPCHRVIGSTGKLTGFGGGLDTKATLLELERGPAPAVAGQADLFA